MCFQQELFWKSGKRKKQCNFDLSDSNGSGDIEVFVNDMQVKRAGELLSLSKTELQLEGLFYTAGTLIIAVGGGSVAGYPVFLWARNSGMFNIRNCHYPLAATLIMMAVLAFVQVILVFVIGKSVKKDSLIDRI